MKLIDCTFRDGGYYNDWIFKANLIEDYIKTLEKFKISYFEVGFRSISSDKYKGPLYYSTDDYLNNTFKNSKVKIGVMINASDIPEIKRDRNSYINSFFPKKKKTIVEIVRIAFHFHEFSKTIEMANILKDKGYIVGINLMQVSEFSFQTIKKIFREINDSSINVFYVADSMGSLNPKEISNLFKYLSDNLNIELGLHAHDNLGLALANSLSALDSGAKWVDSTIAGMGRGAGNVKTEEVIFHLRNKYLADDNISKLSELINNYFIDLKKNYGWGTNIYYSLAGKYKIHPTFIQNILDINSLTSKEKINSTLNLTKFKSDKFNKNLLNESISFFSSKPKNNSINSIYKKFNEILIIGSSPHFIDYSLEETVYYIKKTKPLVISLNSPPKSILKFTDIIAISHPVRLTDNLFNIFKLNKKILLPYSSLPDNLLKLISSSKKIIDYGKQVVENDYKVYKSFCKLPNDLALSYALAYSTSLKPKKIKLAGIYGYTNNQKLNLEIENTIKIFKEKIDIKSITPTILSIESESIFQE